MGKLHDFLMNNDIDTEVTEEVLISPFPAPFIVKSITEAENKVLRKSCQKISFNKKSHQKEVDTDSDLYISRLVIASCVEPNFKDAALHTKFGVMGAEMLLDKILNPGQYAELAQAVQRVNGYDEDINDKIEEAKN